jgi:release factor glutamine methyltransferase
VSRPPDPAPPTYGTAQAWARNTLAGSESGALEAEVLLAFAANRTRAEILAHPEAPLQPQVGNVYARLIARCAAGEPLAYLTGEREFFGLPFFVTPDVLIPRPETERLVETALEWLARRAGPIRVADVGTGSGCIAAVLAVRCPAARITATDISPAALAVARRNIARHGAAARVELVQTDLLAGVGGPFDLICANLPYIPTAKLETLPLLRYEPRAALDGGADGLRLIERLLVQAQTRLAAGGCILLETESTLGAQTRNLARPYFPGAEIHLRKDLAGLNRLVEIQQPGNLPRT